METITETEVYQGGTTSRKVEIYLPIDPENTMACQIIDKITSGLNTDDILGQELEGGAATPTI